MNDFEEELENGELVKYPMEEEQLEAILKEKKAKVKERFSKESLDGVDKEENMRLKEALKEKAEKVRRKNKKMLEDLVSRMMNENFRNLVEQPLEEFRRESRAQKAEEVERNEEEGKGLLEQAETFEWTEREVETWEELQKGVGQFVDRVRTSLTPMTASKQKMLYEFLTRKMAEKGRECFEDLAKCLKVVLMAKDSRIGLLVEKAKGCEELLTKIKQSGKQRVEELEETVECLGLEREALERRLETQARELRGEMREKEKNFEEEVKEMREEAQKKEEKERGEKEKLRELTEKLRKETNEGETREMLLRQKIEFLEKEKAEWREEREKLERKVGELEDRGEEDVQKMRRQFEMEVRSLRQEHKKTREQFREYKEEVTQQSILQESMCRQMGTKEEDLMGKVEAMKGELRGARKREADVFEDLKKVEKDLEEVRAELMEEKEKKARQSEEGNEVRRELGVVKKSHEKKGK